MQFVHDSAEHHFITTLEQLKANPKGWVVFYFALSRMTAHAELIADPAKMGAKISQLRAVSGQFAEELLRLSEGIAKGFVYLFADHDVLFLAHPEGEAEMALTSSVYGEMGKYAQGGQPSRSMLGDDLYNYQKLADAKLLSAKRFEIYKAMNDVNKVSSIAARRARRDAPKVMIVEDDRFTASYAANILSKDYDLFICRTGEEGVIAYIEHAPDIVFLDIHLPGIDGHETLHAIKAVDSRAFIVMLSVDTARSSIVQATQTGAHSFLKKPFSKERLLNTVKLSPYVRGIYDDEDGSVH